jgi:IS30 family transposase
MHTSPLKAPKIKKTPLTIRERTILETRYCTDGKSIPEIVLGIGKHRTTITREIGTSSRRGVGKYRAEVAHNHYLKAVAQRGNKRKIDRLPELKKYITEKLKIRWSPEQISGRLRHEHPDDPDYHISHEAIYQFVYSQYFRGGNGKVREGCEDLRQYLPRHHMRRATKGARKAQKQERITSLPSIEARSPEVLLRTSIGDWEDDLIVSRDGKAQVKSLNERVSGIHFFRKTAGRNAEECDVQVLKCFEGIEKEYRRTLTRDRGAENRKYHHLETSLGIKVYFAHAYCSYERGSNENGNGLLRYYFPKGTNLDMISEEDLMKAEILINMRPRKRLGYLSPAEFYYQKTGCALYV